MLPQPDPPPAGDDLEPGIVKPDRDLYTFRLLDQHYGLPKGSAFRAFKRVLPGLAEGIDFERLDALDAAARIGELKRRERVYRTSRHVVLLSAAARTAVERELRSSTGRRTDSGRGNVSVTESIRDKLIQGLAPLHLEVVNESRMHNVPDGSESHFKVLVVADQFEGKRLLVRHRAVNALLAEELAGPVHALAIHAHTPEEWFERGGQVPESPPCLGGDKGV
jgi:BolA protein